VNPSEIEHRGTGRWLGLVAAVTTSVALLAAPQNPPAAPPPATESPQSPAPATPPAATPPDAVTLVGAGDIANCTIAGGSGAVATGRLLDQIPGTIFTLGDHAYLSGTAEEFRDCYGPRWGRFKDRTRPSPGNHDYLTNNGQAYFEFFGDAAGPKGRGYYSYDLGAWHIISLNSTVDASGRSEQMKWLKEDLAAHHTACMLAYWHIPVFSSGPHGQDLREAAHMLDVWHALYDNGVDVVVNGHDHDYERFAPQDPDGKPTPKGIREFIVGTGGGGLYEFKRPKPNSEIRNNRSYGVIKFTLRASDYSWDYVPGAGEQFHDSGTAACTP
jgi:3',5'-cyclic AMP phosphodiesterase CpdA